MAETQYNIQRGVAVWSSDFTATRDRDGKWTGTHSFHCHLDDCPILMPKQGAKCQEPGYSFLGFESATVRNIEGKVGKVTCTFVGDSSESGDFSFDDPNAEYTITVSNTTVEEPLETHPRYKGLFEDVDGEPVDGIVPQALADIKSGKMKLVSKDENGAKFVFRGADPEGQSLTTLADTALELAYHFLKGVTHYLAAQQVVTISYVQRNAVAASRYDLVGYIVDPADMPAGSPAPPSLERNYLFTGLNVVEEGGLYNVTEEYRLSGIGKWNETIYTDA